MHKNGKHKTVRSRQTASKSSRPPIRWFPLWHLVVGFSSLVWFVLRVGTKPARINYPCQRVAAPLASGFLLWLVGMVSSLAVHRKYRLLIQKVGRRAAIVCLCLGVVSMIAFLGVRVKDALGISDPVHEHAPIGSGSPKVVSVYDEDASNWSGQSYYWNYVNQDVVNSMMTRAITEMTGTATTNQAWQDILPDYSAGETIAIKVNFNNNDELNFNSLPQPVVALINQLKGFGFAESEIYVYDTSRSITSGTPNSIQYFFRDTVETAFPGVTIIDNTTSNRWSSNLFTTYHAYDGSVSTPYAKILDDADYLINVPIMRAHAISGVTFGFKNHYGSIQQIVFAGGVVPLHDGIRQDHDGYSEAGVPLVELNSLAVIENKTVLVIGDGIYSHSSTNTSPPNRNPEVILMSKDPVALDSVMFDYFHTLSSRQVWHQNYLHLAAAAGLGVHDHYPYSRIDYVEITDSGSANIPPNAVAEANPTAGTVPLSVQFDGTDSSDSDGTIEVYHWDFGDENSDNGDIVWHTYTSPDTYTATLTVTDDGGATDHDTVVVTANPPAQPGDSDGDGLSDADETGIYGTDPNDADSDDDRLTDGDEVLSIGSSPQDTDSDDDGIPDFDEVNYDGDPGFDPYDPIVNPTGTDLDPTNEDTDGDGLSDNDELTYSGTNPISSDTDADGILDGEDRWPLHAQTPVFTSSGRMLAVFVLIVLGVLAAGPVRRFRRASE